MNALSTVAMMLAMIVALAAQHAEAAQSTSVPMVNKAPLLECSLILEKSPEGADSLTLLLRNPSDQTVTVRTNSDPLATLLVDIFDEQGRKITVGARRFSTGERQHFDETTIAAQSEKDWRVNLASRLLPTVDLTNPFTANVVASLIYSVRLTSGGAEFQSAVCTANQAGVTLGGPRP